MENTGVNITLRKDGRYMGKFIAGYDDSGKAQYQYVYGRTYDEAKSKMLIGREVASRYLSGRYITVSKVYSEWLNAVVNRVKESTFANYKTKCEFCGKLYNVLLYSKTGLTKMMTGSTLVESKA